MSFFEIRKSLNETRRVLQQPASLEPGQPETLPAPSETLACGIEILPAPWYDFICVYAINHGGKIEIGARITVYDYSGEPLTFTRVGGGYLHKKQIYRTPV